MRIGTSREAPGCGTVSSVVARSPNCATPMTAGLKYIEWPADRKPFQNPASTSRRSSSA
jgi:hypothetical protein